MANTGNKGKFSERIKRIRLSKLWKRRKPHFEDNEVMYKNFLKVVAVIPLIAVENMFNSNVNNKPQNKDENTLKDAYEIRKKIYFKNRNDNRKKIENIDVSLMKKKQELYIKSVKNYAGNDIKETKLIQKKEKDNGINNQKKEELKSVSVGINLDKKEETINRVDNIEISEKNTVKSAKDLEKKIIDIIQKDLVKMKNELEIYESELFILSEVSNDEKTLEECRANIAKVKKLLAKIEQIKSKYDYLKDNYDFEYLVAANNPELIDRIIELKNMFGENEVIATVSDYKLLEIYKSLYLQIDDIREKTYKIEEEKLKKEEDLRERDIDFNKLKMKVYDTDKINDSYTYFVKQQNEFLRELNEKISKIDSREVTNYRLLGTSKFLFSTFKYLGLLMLNPLKGLFPSIVTQTLLAKNAVHNLRNSIVCEKETKLVYEAIDYSSAIGRSIDDIDGTSRMLDETLDDLMKMKMEYNDRFRKYHGDFLEYRAVMHKINSIQENMINNKIKMEIMRSKMMIYDKQNKEKMGKVRKLNAMDNRITTSIE